MFFFFSKIFCWFVCLFFLAANNHFTKICSIVGVCKISSMYMYLCPGCSGTAYLRNVIIIDCQHSCQYNKVDYFLNHCAYATH